MAMNTNASEKHRIDPFKKKKKKCPECGLEIYALGMGNHRKAHFVKSAKLKATQSKENGE